MGYFRFSFGFHYYPFICCLWSKFYARMNCPFYSFLSSFTTTFLYVLFIFSFFFAHLISLDYIWINMRRKIYINIYINLPCLNVDVWIKPDLTGSPYRNSVPSYFFSVGASYSNYYASFGTISTQHLHLHLHLHRLSCQLQHSIEEYSLLSHSSALPVSNQTNLKVQNV